MDGITVAEKPVLVVQDYTCAVGELRFISPVGPVVINTPSSEPRTEGLEFLYMDRHD